MNCNIVYDNNNKHIIMNTTIIITHSERTLFNLNARVEARGIIALLSRETTQGHLN